MSIHIQFSIYSLIPISATVLLACGTQVPGNGQTVAGHAGLALTAFSPPKTSAAALRNGRPAVVPQDFVVTPNGYFHPSCISTLAADEAMDQAAGQIRKRDGSTRNITPCAFPHYTARGQAIAPGGDSGSGEKTPSFFHSWVEDGNDASHGAIASLTAQWVVPQPPATASHQTLYYFPGLEDLANTNRIIQPVLGWTGGTWTIQSWNCCVNGTTFNGNQIAVSSGDTITGTMQGSSCSQQTGICSWVIIATDTRTNQHATLTTTVGEPMTWSFGGAFEAYDIGSCAEYASNGAVTNSITFSSILATTVAGSNPTITFSPSLFGPLNPTCAYSVNTSQAGTVQLSWNSSDLWFGPPTEWSSTDFQGSVANLLGDVNGDGKADAVGFNGATTYVMLSNGSSFGSNRPAKGALASAFGR